MHLNDYAISPQKRINIIKTNRVNPNNISDKDKEGNILLDIDFDLLAPEPRERSSFNAGNQYNARGGTKFNNFENIQQEQATKVSSVDAIDSKNNYSSLEKTLNSLARVDITGLLESINFDKSNDHEIPKFQNFQNTNQIMPSINSGSNQNYDHSLASSTTMHKYSQNVLPSIDFTLSKNTINNINPTDTIYRTENPSISTSRKNLDFSNFEDLLQIGTTKYEDKFDKSMIRKQIRGIIIV
jgi:uncharacterized protein YjgD (DUF1641 family)